MAIKYIIMQPALVKSMSLSSGSMLATITISTESCRLHDENLQLQTGIYQYPCDKLGD